MTTELEKIIRKLGRDPKEVDEVIQDLLEQGVPLESILASLRAKSKKAINWEP